MKVTFTVDEKQLKKLVADYFFEKTSQSIDVNKIEFRVKSKNNYRPQEWENGEFKASYEGDI